MSFPERYELERSARWLFLAAPWVTAALALLSAIAPVLPDDGKPRNESAVVVLAILGCCMFGLGSWYSFRIVRRLPEAAITVDEDGLWPTFRDKSIALIRWNDIVRLREREIMQRLEALDASGKVIARLEYQLCDFQRLRAIVLERASLDRSVGSALDVHQKSLWYHLFSLGSMIGFSLLGLYVGQTEPLVGYGGMAVVVGMIAWEYWNTPVRLRVTRNALEVDWPARRKTVPRECVMGIDVEDEIVNSARHPRVTVSLLDGFKPIQLKDLGLQAVELHQVLKAWRRGDV